MGTQVRTIEQALRDSAPAPTIEARATPFDGDAAAAAISQLKTLLEASDGGAKEAFRGLQEAVAGQLRSRNWMLSRI
jgi:uncharacterized protein YbjT (DUF2867 family)